MEELKENQLVDKIVSKCKSMGMTNEETYVIGCISCSEDAYKKYGSETESMKKALDILSQSTSFADAVTKIEKAMEM